MRYDQLIYQFMKKIRDEDEEKYQEVCEKYPILSKQQQEHIREHEISLEHIEEEREHA